MRLPGVAADTVVPACRHFGACGGCQLQDLAYPAQMKLKADRLLGMLAPSGIPLPEIEAHPSPPLGYRNRIRLTLTKVDGELCAGYVRAEREARATNALSILPIKECLIAAPILWRATETFLATLNERSDLWVDQPQITMDQLELFTNPGESHLQFTLSLRTNRKGLPSSFGTGFTSLCEAIRTRIPELTGAGIAVLPLASADRSRRAETVRPGPSWGSPGLIYPVGKHSYWVPRTAFFQVNRFLLPDLLQLITAQAGLCLEKALAWDLYAGAGLFAHPLAGHFAEVVAVEIAEPAFAALSSTKLSNLHAIKATTLDFLRAAVVQRERPALIVLDPPRSGAGPEVCALLARIAAPTVVYVSCSPQTLPADLTTLAESGYRVTKLHLFDLFPQTNHLETVTILTR